VLALADATAGVGVKYPLDAVKQFLAHQGVVPPLVLNAFVDKLANVVPIPQHPVQRVTGNRLIAVRRTES